jgi:hypothetical protein
MKDAATSLGYCACREIPTATGMMSSKTHQGESSLLGPARWAV